MPDKLTNVTHPPKVTLDEALLRVRPKLSLIEKALLRRWWQNMVELYRDHPYVDSDIWDAISEEIGVPFWDTLETHTLLKPDGTPWTMTDQLEQVQRLRAATRGKVPNDR